MAEKVNRTIKDNFEYYQCCNHGRDRKTCFNISPKN